MHETGLSVPVSHHDRRGDDVAAALAALAPAADAAMASDAEDDFFEGSEKRLEIHADFADARTAGAAGRMMRSERSAAGGLRRIPRDKIDAFLEAAGCTVLSTCSNAVYDAYVLSESSLFVAADRMVIKTCGQTPLINAMPLVRRCVAELGMEVTYVKYSRASFLNGGRQHPGHRCFEKEETVRLREIASQMGMKSRAYVLGEQGSDPEALRWHVFCASRPALPGAPAAAEHAVGGGRYTLEVCMTGLDPVEVKACCGGPAGAPAAPQNSGYETAAEALGLLKIFPAERVDEHLFEPYGYSMNGLQGGSFSTVHVTPQESCSYASVEVAGFELDALDPECVAINSAKAFRPKRITAAITLDAPAYPAVAANPAAALVLAAEIGGLRPPTGYAIADTVVQTLPGGGAVVMHQFERVTPQITTCTSMCGAVASRCLEPASADSSMWASESDDSSIEDYAAPSEVGAISRLPSRKSAPAFGPAARANTLATIRRVGASFNAVYAEGATLDESSALAAKAAIAKNCIDEPFYVVNLGVLQERWEMWRTLLPRVEPHYAVKCNNDQGLLATMAALGAGFDCASPAEVAMVTAHGVAPERIVFANAMKTTKHMTQVRAAGVPMTTFDSASELYKLAETWPEAKLLLRIRADDPGARCELGSKYGVHESECEPLLKLAKELNLDVEGVAFHVGSGLSDPTSPVVAVKFARRVFDMAAHLGLSPLRTLDVGGGFPGGQAPEEIKHFGAIAANLDAALDELFPPSMGVRIIAEPGRYFAEGIASLSAPIFGRRARPNAGGEMAMEYWIADGIYGSMNCLLYDHAELSARPLYAEDFAQGAARDRAALSSTVFGPTCDGLDTILREAQLPKMEVGEWLEFPNMGAYTLVAASRFNGFAPRRAQMIYVQPPMDA